MKIKLKDINIPSIRAIESTERPRLDSEVFDILIGERKVLRGVSGRDMGLSDMFWNWFLLEDGDCPTAMEIAEFRVGKVVELLNEAMRIAKELDVSIDVDVVFDGKRQHPHMKHTVRGDRIVKTSTK